MIAVEHVGPFAASIVGADATFFDSTLRAYPRPKQFSGFGSEADNGPVVSQEN